MNYILVEYQLQVIYCTTNNMSSIDNIKSESSIVYTSDVVYTSDDEEDIYNNCRFCKQPSHEPVLRPNMTPNEYMDMLQQLSKDKGCFVAMKKYTKYFSWVLLSWRLVNVIADELKNAEEPIVEVFAGAGWLSYFINCVSEKKVIPSDICSKGDTKSWFRHERSYAPIEIETIDALEHIEKVKPKTLIMSYPIYNDPLAFNVIKRFIELGGTKLIYHGEIDGNCATEQFFEYIDHFESKWLIPYKELDKWVCFRDCILMYDFTKPTYKFEIRDLKTLNTEELNKWINDIIGYENEYEFTTFEELKNYILQNKYEDYKNKNLLLKSVRFIGSCLNICYE